VVILSYCKLDTKSVCTSSHATALIERLILIPPDIVNILKQIAALMIRFFLLKITTLWYTINPITFIWQRTGPELRGAGPFHVYRRGHGKTASGIHQGPRSRWGHYPALLSFCLYRLRVRYPRELLERAPDCHQVIAFDMKSPRNHTLKGLFTIVDCHLTADGSAPC
jgi:hypothetical protein